MANGNLSAKRLLIDKANLTMVVAVSAATFLTIFSAFATKALLDQRSFQSRVIKEKQVAAKQLQENIKAVENLSSSYQAFTNTPTNILGGKSTGTGERDGDNPQIILNALPSKYDFPALATSIEKMLNTKNIAISTIAGSDDEVAQSAVQSSATPAPVEMPIKVTVKGNYDAVRTAASLFEQSIRPFEMKNVTISGGGNNMQLELSLITYFQPPKNLSITTKDIK